MFRARFCALAIAIVIAASLLEIRLSHAGESPLAECWRQADSRIQLKPCLQQLLRDADQRLDGAQSKIEREAAELDRVTDGGMRNVELSRASDTSWRAYRDAECARQAQAMSPGTGSGDMYLACRITLTDERLEHLRMP